MRFPVSSFSWPSLPDGPTETGLSAKTPAALSPMIRSVLRLWCHESSRTYSDRLFTEEQRYWFSSLLHETVEEFFFKANSELGSEAFSVEQVNVQNNSQGTQMWQLLMATCCYIVIPKRLVEVQSI